MARGRPLSVCITDIDRFKLVNDTYGHDAGDAVLREFANRVRSAVRGADLACRYGGEEFVLVMPDTSAEMAAGVAERLRAIVEQEPFRLPGTDVLLPITASLGLASALPAGDRPEALLKRADTALYEAKRSGRNRVVAAAA
jgi:two-component system cell cycle response regulator